MARMSGTISSRSRSAAARASIASASLPPTCVSGTSASAVAQPLDGRAGVGGPGLGGERRPRSGSAPSPDAVTRADPTPGVCSTAASTSLAVGAGQHLGRLDGAGREGLGEPLGGGDRLGPVEQLVGLVEPEPHADRARWRGRPAAPACRRRPPAGRRDTSRPTRWKTVSASTAAWSPCRGTIGQKTQRPKSTSAAGSTTSANVAATTTPTAHARPRPRVAGVSESSSVSTARNDRGRAAEHRLRRTTQRVRHRLVPGGGRAQLVAVAGDQQQRVVGAGAEDEHREDAGRGAVPGQRRPRRASGWRRRRRPGRRGRPRRAGSARAPGCGRSPPAAPRRSASSRAAAAGRRRRRPCRGRRGCRPAR